MAKRKLIDFCEVCGLLPEPMTYITVGYGESLSEVCDDCATLCGFKDGTQGTIEIEIEDEEVSE